MIVISGKFKSETMAMCSTLILHHCWLLGCRGIREDGGLCENHFYDRVFVEKNGFWNVFSDIIEERHAGWV